MCSWKCCFRYSSSSDGDSGHHREKKPYKCKHILTQRSLLLDHVPSHNFTLQCSALTQHGYNPNTVERENQDSFCNRTQIQGNPNSGIDDTMSGTTLITVLVVRDTLYVGNVGDSRALMAVKDGDRILAEDQTPFRKDEYERVKLCGARVLSVDQVEGLKTQIFRIGVMKKSKAMILRQNEKYLKYRERGEVQSRGRWERRRG
ncbi:hypothetical protein V6N13_098884 [Hibiscus sabdariffa]|uniref:PPM-type phosphatase domain-containing protein n=1 Tax=Hibiscus sabdariffa TaxID=183260 RepID=A0ABR2EF84_9ROSI